MSASQIAVLDIGKTNAKLLQIDANSGEIAWNCEYSYQCRTADGYRQLPLEALEAWLWRSLADMPGKSAITHLVPVTHGAAAVLLGADHSAVAMPDYEDPIYESTRQPYADERDSYADTCSPLLPLGLNLGRQLHWLKEQRPASIRDCRAVLLYPQYWAWRLCGVMACELTSLGCHTDLWRPAQQRFSAYAQRSGWAAHFPPLRAAQESLGMVNPDVVQRTGINAACRVLCGIHDSNAAYYCHLNAHAESQAFAVISSGTCTILMAHGAELTRLAATRDMLANLDARGGVVATARFMGGREYEVIAGPPEQRAAATASALQHVLQQQALALPSFIPGSGPFPEREGQLLNAAALSPDQRCALALLYLALMCELRLEDLGASGDIIIDGPLATDALFGQLLAALLPQRPVWRSDARAGIAYGALALVLGERAPRLHSSRVTAVELAGLADYRASWRRRLQ